MTIKCKVPPMPVGKNKTRIQAIIHRTDRDLIKKLAEAQDRSESYIVSKIIENYLHGDRVVRNRKNS